MYRYSCTKIDVLLYVLSASLIHRNKFYRKISNTFILCYNSYVNY